jgi:hypothetical protein
MREFLLRFHWKVAVLIVFVFIALFVLISSFLLPKKQSAEIPSTSKTYTGTYFKLTYPENWELVATRGQDIYGYVFAPDTTSRPVPAFTVSVFTQPTMSLLTRQSVVLPVAEQSTVAFNGRNAVMFTFTIGNGAIEDHLYEERGTTQFEIVRRYKADDSSQKQLMDSITASFFLN